MKIAYQNKENKNKLPLRITGAEPSDRKKAFSISLDEHKIDTITISPNHKILIESSDAVIRVFGRLIWVLEGHSDPICSIVLLDGQRVLSKTRTSAKMWDIESGEELPTDESPFEEEPHSEEEYRRIEAKVEVIEQCNSMNFFGDYAIEVYKSYDEAELYDDSYTRKAWLGGDLSIKKQRFLDNIFLKKSGYILTYDKHGDLVVMDSKRKITFVNFRKASLQSVFISPDTSRVVFQFKDRSYVYDIDKDWTRIVALILDRDDKFLKLKCDNIPPQQEESITHTLEEEALLFVKIKRENRLKKIRNIAVFSDNDKKRTVLADKMLSYMNYENYDDTHGASLDWMECERDIDTVIVSPLATESWLEREINMIQISSLFELHTMRVIDGGVTLLSAISEIEPLMVALHKMQMKHHVPSVIFVGQMEKKGADFFAKTQEIQAKFSTVPLVTQLPIGEGKQFEGLIDLISMREFIWDEVNEVNDEYMSFRRDSPTEHEIREELMPHAIVYQQKMLEQLAEIDGNEKLMEKFLEDKEINQEEIVEAIRVATLSMVVTPILLGCVFNNKGLKKLLDAVVAYLPSPSLSVEAEHIMDNHKKITLHVNEAEPFVGVVFALETDPFVGELSVVRIYRGSLKLGSSIYNTTQNREDKVNRILKFYAIKREELDEVLAGDILYITGLKAKIGDTLCDPSHKVLLESIENIEPLFLVRVAVDHAENRNMVSFAIEQIGKENPLCKIFYDEHIFIYGESKLKLEQIVSRLREHYHLDVESHEPQIVYYRTIKIALEKEYVYKEKKKFADIALRFESQERGVGYKFVDEIKGGIVPKEFMYPIHQGIQEALQEGIGDGYPIIDIKATLYNGSYHDVYSNGETFKRAGYEATKELLKEAEFLLLEPIMKLNVKVESEELRKAILADIGKRRGIACGRGGDEHNLGDIYVPLAEILDYEEELYVLSDGQASYELVFERYELVPEYLIEGIGVD